MNSGELFREEAVEFEGVRDGDWIRVSGWRKPRRVAVAEMQQGERSIYLEHPDGVPGVLRRADWDALLARAPNAKWTRMPNVRVLFDGAR
jgi:hypothetical protein